METLETIIEKYKDFNIYLEGIDLSEFSNRYTRKELESLAKQIYSVKLRSLSYEINQLADAMKLEEYPELKGVHHYPELTAIDFLSEEEKGSLDETLVKYRVGNFIVPHFYHITNDENKYQQIMEYLLGQKIVGQEFYALCPNCNEEHISERLSKDDKEHLESAIKDNVLKDRYAIFERYLSFTCDECETDLNFDKLTSLYYKPVFVLIKERDKSLDNA